MSNSITKFYLSFIPGLFLATALLLPTPLFAMVSMQACLVAAEECAALHSIKRKTNPGSIFLEKDQQYHIKGRNKKKNATHYQIRIDANPNLRWVPVECGVVQPRCGIVTPPDIGKPEPEPAKNYLLALSWQPAFCQSHQTKKECKNQTKDRYDASNFSIHGLWPQPRNNAYCGVIPKYRSIARNKRWGLLPELDLLKETRNQLKIVMPGYLSSLHRYQWIKHGTCYSETAEEYFAETLILTKQINESGLSDLFTNNLGNFITIDDIKQQINQDFGDFAGDKVSIRCDRKGNIGELWINLRGDINLQSDVSKLLENAPDATSRCRNNGGYVDPVGF